MTEQTDPPTGEPTAEERKAGIAGVFDRAAATYDQVGLDFFGVIGDRLAAAAAPQPGERVLDLGSGRGASAIPTARAVGPTGAVHATDLAPGMVAALGDLARDLPWLTAEVRDAEDPPDGPWDLVLGSLVLFFLPGLDDAVRRYRRELADGGRLAFTWFGDADESWDEVYDALAADIPEEHRPPRGTPRKGPFSGRDAMAEFLTDAGFDEHHTETHRITIEMAAASQYWQWMWSQGMRYLLEQLDSAGQLTAAQERVQPLLDERLLRDGVLRWWTDVHYTVARPG
jgi:ubiquinone/menaquinone biosynthesis C-methylase UbiE